tara:strand:- start:489 stop:1142 length:654 start_codon:yes stop_codon:yes gene_type:complete
MRAAVLFSGGKDSTFALFKEKNNHDIQCLITLFPKRNDSYMFHYPNIELVKYQAEELNLPLITQKTEGEKEKELIDLETAIKKAIKEYKIEVLISGALASEYQKSRIEKLCKKLNIKSIAPLWHIDPEDYLNQLIKNKFEVIIIGIAADGLNESYLGRIIDKQLIEDFKKLNIHLGAEGGEYETFVLNCPLFKKGLKIKKQEKIMENENAGTLKIFI